MIDGPSAIDLASVQGLKLNPRVCMSLSLRTPGYRKRSQVPPMSERPSRMVNVRSGHSVCRWYAAPMPEIPAPTISTST